MLFVYTRTVLVRLLQQFHRLVLLRRVMIDLRDRYKLFLSRFFLLSHCHSFELYSLVFSVGSYCTAFPMPRPRSSLPQTINAPFVGTRCSLLRNYPATTCCTS